MPSTSTSIATPDLDISELYYYTKRSLVQPLNITFGTKEYISTFKIYKWSYAVFIAEKRANRGQIFLKPVLLEEAQ